MKTCDTCKHWKGCHLQYKFYKICRVLEDKRNMSPEDGIVFAGSADDERNEIHTGPKFGCIHHQEKS